MKILYFTDDYTWNIYGTKRSTAEALQDTGHTVFIVDKVEIGSLPALAAQEKPDQIWLFHSDLRLPERMKEEISQPIIGFGISDPYYFSTDRFASYDVYVTYNKATCEQVCSLIPTVYNRTACDFKFHKPLNIPKTCDATIIGAAIHERFANKKKRIDCVEGLRRDTGRTIHAYGKHWPQHADNFSHIDGEDLLLAINSGHLGLDIQDHFSPLAHRMFECAACGVPIITRRRDEVFECFEEGREILAYTDYEELRDVFVWHLDHPGKLESIGRRAMERCLDEHDIRHRIPGLVNGINRALGV